MTPVRLMRGAPRAAVAKGRAGDGGDEAAGLASIAFLVGMAGIALVAVGLVLDARQALASYLVACVTVLTTALGALTLAMIGFLVRARWMVAYRRLTMAVVSALPLVALLVLPLLVMPRALYPWASPELIADPGTRALIRAKSAWLDVPFFVARAVVYVATWMVLSWLLFGWWRRGPVPRRDGPDGVAAARLRRLSAAGLPAVAVTLTFASFDWLMSLSPAWYSTVYGVYVFAGGMVACLALLAVLGRLVDRADRTDRTGTRGGMGEDAHAGVHLARLGMLLLAFLIFWAYIGYSQYLVIWIADVPLEIGWYLTRARGSWGALALLMIVAGFALPVLLLLWHSFKRRPVAMAVLGAWLLVVHWFDVYWLVLPELHPAGIRPHWLDAAAFAGVAGLAVCAGLVRTARLPDPVREGADPEEQRTMAR